MLSLKLQEIFTSIEKKQFFSMTKMTSFLLVKTLVSHIEQSLSNTMSNTH